MAAANNVFGVTELLEDILLNTSQQDVLRLHRVIDKFKDVIAGSEALQDHVWARPVISQELKMGSFTFRLPSAPNPHSKIPDGSPLEGQYLTHPITIDIAFHVLGRGPWINGVRWARLETFCRTDTVARMRDIALKAIIFVNEVAAKQNEAEVQRTLGTFDKEDMALLAEVEYGRGYVGITMEGDTRSRDVVTYKPSEDGELKLQPSRCCLQ